MKCPFPRKGHDCCLVVNTCLVVKSDYLPWRTSGSGPWRGCTARFLHRTMNTCWCRCCRDWIRRMSNDWMVGSLMRSSFWMKTRMMDLDSCYFRFRIYWVIHILYLFPCYHKSEKREKWIIEAWKDVVILCCKQRSGSKTNISLNSHRKTACKPTKICKQGERGFTFSIELILCNDWCFETLLTFLKWPESCRSFYASFTCVSNQASTTLSLLPTAQQSSLQIMAKRFRRMFNVHADTWEKSSPREFILKWRVIGIQIGNVVTRMPTVKNIHTKRKSALRWRSLWQQKTYKVHYSPE